MNLNTRIVESKLVKALENGISFNDKPIIIDSDEIVILSFDNRISREMIEYFEADAYCKGQLNNMLSYLIEVIQVVDDSTLIEFFKLIKNSWIRKQLNLKLDPLFNTNIIKSRLQKVLDKVNGFNSEVERFRESEIDINPFSNDMFEYQIADMENLIESILIQALKDIEFVNDCTLKNFLMSIKNEWIYQQLSV